MNAFETCYASVIASEGGWVNNPKDPGGETNLGVTRAAWVAWVNRPLAAGEMRQLTVDQVKPFYRANYWNAIHGDSFPAAVALCLFHVAVNAGARRAAKLLQATVETLADGSIGPGTIAATTAWMQAHGQHALVTAFQDQLRAFYRSLSTFSTFGKGWLNRAADVEQQAIRLIP